MVNPTTNFVWKAKDKFGRPVVREVPANSAQESKEILIAEGCTELSLVRDEIGAVAASAMQDKITMMGEEVRINVEDAIKSQQRPPPTFFRVLFVDGIWKSKNLVLIIVAVAAYEYYTGNHFAWIFFAIGLAAWLAFVVGVSLPSIYYRKLHEAADWSRWTEVLQIVATLRKTNTFHIIKLPAPELGRFRAVALAGLGRVPDALQEYSQYENQPGCPSWLHKTFVASIYNTAKQYDTALEWNLKAIQEKPSQALYLDLANRYARYKKDPVRARAAMVEGEKGPLSEVAIIFQKRCLGIIAYLEQNWSAARQELEAVLQLIEQKPRLPYRAGLMNITKAYLCCVLARQGDYAGAKKKLGEARPYLVATGERELLAECENSVGAGKV